MNLDKISESKQDTNQDTVLFWDGFGLNVRGLIQIYMKALCKVMKVVYVTYEDRKDQIPDVQDILNEYHAERYYVAGYTTLFSYVLFVVGNYYAMIKIVKEKSLPTHRYDIKGLLLILALFMVLGFTGMALYNYMVVRICIAVVVFVIIILNRNRLLNYWRMIKNG